jgi:hypothetical protein
MKIGRRYETLEGTEEEEKGIFLTLGKFIVTLYY